MNLIEEKGLASLKARVKSLHDLLEQGVPNLLIAKQILFIFEAALLFCPKELGQVFFHSLAQHQRTDAGFCRMCDHRIVGEETSSYYCQSCTDKIIAEEPSVYRENPTA